MRAHLPRLIAYAVVAAGMLICRAGFLDDVFYNIDEGEYAVAADALRHGWLPGVDLLGSSKPPGIVLWCFAFFGIAGRSLAVLHVAQLIAVILTGVFVIEIARRLWDDRAMLPAAALFVIISNSFSLPQRILSVNVESPGTLFALFGLWLLLIATRDAQRLVAGIAFGAALIFRQSFLFFLIPAAYLAALAPRRQKSLSYVLGGVALPWLALLVPYALRDRLGWALDSWVRYPLDYASDIGLAGFFAALGLNSLEFAAREWPALILSTAGLIALWGERTSVRAKFLLLLLLASVLALSSGSRFTGQYWIQTFPGLALLATTGWLYVAHRWSGYRIGLAVVMLAGALLALGHFPFWRTWDPAAAPKGVSPYAVTAGQLELQAGAFARERTRPGESILVWGYCPQIYYHAERLPGVRDYIVHYITGLSPGAFDPYTERAPRDSGHPRAQELFVEDLKRRRPMYVFDLSDIAEGEFPLIQYPLTLYPSVAAHMRAHYVPDTMLGGMYVYRLRSDNDSPNLPEPR